MNRKRLGKGWIMALAMLLVWCGPVRAAVDVPAGEGTVSMQAAADQAGPVTLRIEGDSTLNNGGTIRVQGQAPAGKPVFLEVWADAHQVRASRFDGEPDPKTGVRPYIFYLTEHMPAYFKIFVPITMQDKIDAVDRKSVV